ncbi:MAG TPA: Ku protein, partial [Limnochordia bacterium]
MASMRSLWNGYLTFGLVTIPVRLCAAAEERKPRFRQLHASCHSPIAYRRYCPSCDTEVPSDEIVRAYRAEDGSATDVWDFEARSPARDGRALEILTFVQPQTIDPVFWDQPYFLAPGRGGHRAYGLLRAALARTQTSAVARGALRAREVLALIRPSGPGLLLHTLRWADEVRDMAALDGLGDIPAADEGELAEAVHL